MSLVARARAGAPFAWAWGVLGAVVAGCASEGGAGGGGSGGAPGDHVPCDTRSAERVLLFGDLHVHTALSFDAAIWGTRARPADAYRYARGEPIGLYPYDASGKPLRTHALARPLDFAAVTDHSEFLAETSLCNDPSSTAYDTATCSQYRGNATGLNPFTLQLAAKLPMRPDVCDESACAAPLASVWGEIQAAAEDAYDRSSACAFTTLVGYEWTGATNGNNLHRNVLFRSAVVPAQPTTYFEARTPELLWSSLRSECTEAGTGCDVLAIPHNSNVAGGTMFVPEKENGKPYDAELAATRRALEPLVEIVQHKGQSECLSGSAHPLASEDEACGFEQLVTSVCTAPDDPPGCTPLCSENGGVGGLAGLCVAPRDFARAALRSGLLEQERLGVNPFAFGFVGSTDTHNGIPGAVDEGDWPGHVGYGDETAEGKLTAPQGGAALAVRYDGPGGLTAVWAEQNTREDVFDALRRREAYATSGSRIALRFFGSFGFDGELCADPELVKRGYAEGVPMGGDLPELPAGGAAPRFVVLAERDPLGADLERVQLVKGWTDGVTTFEEVFDMAGGDGGATVDLATCEPVGQGSATLCASWTDPAFDPASPAFYYVRVLEVPTCRWSRRVCNEARVDCASTPPESPLSACCDGSVPDTIRERAWSSPIWYTP